MDKDEDIMNIFLKWAEANSIHPITVDFFKKNKHFLEHNLPIMVIQTISRMQYRYDTNISLLKELLKEASDLNDLDGLYTSYIKHLDEMEQDIIEETERLDKENQELEKQAKNQNMDIHERFNKLIKDLLHNPTVSAGGTGTVKSYQSRPRTFKNATKTKKPINEGQIKDLLIDLNTCEDVNDFINRM